MNTKQKVLTLLAIAAFVFIIFFQRHVWGLPLLRFHGLRVTANGEVIDDSAGVVLESAGKELLSLTVIYTGLFFILRTERKP